MATRAFVVLLLTVRADASETLLYQDYSSTTANLYQGSAVAGVSVASKDSIFTCGHTSSKTCGITPTGCSAFPRTASSASSTTCGASDVLVTSHGMRGSLQWLKLIGGKDTDRCNAVDSSSGTVVVLIMAG